ncbi:MAG: hypothetical protein PHC28_01665 [Flavobacterium sp.]|uniref:hypothetical protein n=1 Tax=Flavobacterium sp. TaxID=239 RepID=UPI002603A73A|nr:hypothetical protein [Flavobacterium sp.]MDD5149175.1 hypothetical protein [Flavobacterium sp.]
MKYFSFIFLFILISCGNKEDILLPKSDVTVVSNVLDHSPIYVFYRTKGKDTLAEVNKRNEIISTSWIFNIDKRLPLRLVIPEVMKLQERKRNEVAHKNELAENYYSYADSIGKNLAFLPFTKVYYKMEKPKSGVVVFFDKNNEIWVNGLILKKDKLENFLNEFLKDKSTNYLFCFAKDLNFGSYVQDEIFIQSLKIENKEEFVD